jgi:hypothetical protein
MARVAAGLRVTSPADRAPAAALGFVRGSVDAVSDVAAIDTSTPELAAFAAERLLSPSTQAETIGLTREGHLLVNVRGETLTRTDALLLCSENVAIRPLNRRMQGRAVPEVFKRLASLAGEGFLVLSRQHERFHAMRLRRDLCFFVERYLWALDATLMWDVGMIPGSRGHGDVSLVRVAGEGLVAIRVPGELVAVKISHERAHRVHVDAFVGWVGNVVPTLERDVPYLRCDGEGAVFVSLPPRERARPSAASSGAAEPADPTSRHAVSVVPGARASGRAAAHPGDPLADSSSDPLGDPLGI